DRDHAGDQSRRHRAALSRAHLVRQHAGHDRPREGSARAGEPGLRAVAGPAPRAPYHDNIIHYNWHWFRRWGTGEILNNGTHEIDVARWALGVGYPTRVTSVGGRYHYADDWEFPDTQEVCFEFADGKTIIWQGQSCNGLSTFGRSRGTAILGSAGSVVLDRDGYTM